MQSQNQNYGASRKPFDYKQAIMFHLDRLSALAIVLDEDLTTARIVQYDFGLNHLESLLAPYIKVFKKNREELEKANVSVSELRPDSNFIKDLLDIQDLRNYFDALKLKLELLIVILYNNNLLPDAIMEDHSSKEVDEGDLYTGNSPNY